MQVCTIVARNYLAHARVLVASYLRHHVDARATVLLVDGLATEALAGDEAFEVVYPHEIGIDPDDLRHMRAIYDVTEFSTALKPKLLQHLLASDNTVPVLYLDPDCQVFAPLDAVSELATQHSLVLTPHVMSPVPRDGMLVDEQTLMWSGIFNLGFVAVSSDALPFLEWWHERLRLDAVKDPEAGLFTDQRWIDFVPALFPHHVLRDHGYNVAYWNLFERPIERADDGSLTAAGRRLSFFHFSGYDPDSPQRLSVHQGDRPRATLTDHRVVADLCSEYAASLRAAGYTRLKQLPYRYGTLAGGPVDVSVRRLVRAALRDPQEEGREPPDPFGDDGGEAFVDWLNEPMISVRNAVVNRLLLAVWHQRRDLQAAFPVVEGPDAVPLERWAALDPEFQQRFGHLYRPQGLRSVPVQRVPPSPGLNVVGYLNAELGVGEAGRLVVGAAERAGVPLATHVYRRTLSRQNAEFLLPNTSGCRYDISVLCANADSTPRLVAQLDQSRTADRYRIGLWFWEVEEFPRSMHAAFECVDEIWVASEFVRDAIQPHTDRSVHLFPLAIVADPPTFFHNADVGVPEGFVFAFCYDQLSVIDRKNPAAVVESFIRAFPAPGEASLVIKSINASNDFGALDRLRRSIGERPDVHLVDDYWSRERMNALVQLCDCYVSLHRSEGFGLTIAAAMAQGKPVIATGYSGNLAFMDESSALLVPYELVPVGPGYDPYPPDARWAEPDVDVAARYMRRVYDDPQWAEQLGRRGRDRVARTHSVEESSRALLAHYDRILGSLVGLGSRVDPRNGSAWRGTWWESIRVPNRVPSFRTPRKSANGRPGS